MTLFIALQDVLNLGFIVLGIGFFCLAILVFVLTRKTSGTTPSDAERFRARDKQVQDRQELRNNLTAAALSYGNALAISINKLNGNEIEESWEDLERLMAERKNLYDIAWENARDAQVINSKNHKRNGVIEKQEATLLELSKA